MESTDITLNGAVATWTLPPTKGEVLGTYSGTWRFRCYLTPIQQLEAGREFRALLGNMAGNATDTESNISFALSQLKQRVISAPPFWDATKQQSAYAGDIPDLNILAIVLDASIRAESLYKESLEKERESVLNKAIAVGEQLLQNKLEE